MKKNIKLIYLLITVFMKNLSKSQKRKMRKDMTLINPLIIVFMKNLSKSQKRKMKKLNLFKT